MVKRLSVVDDKTFFNCNKVILVCELTDRLVRLNS